ncbi:Cytoplasmic phosphatidylinositol transfer protein 1 [Intoshia linei]|uniref:Cytoplasmic phosphatidylinositol transfer protein 1 n=1 Tax=Intoshia linei TaxID=1819745 RepID=A0A177B096_9BILA|nr:Cytoplasmic phosphatidylinositol transfer protein 1 [Intoshia linei]
MLTKEYRIPLPMSLEDYRIGQLYMIQKKTKESHSSKVQIEILVNEPYENKEKNEKGQYTHKIYILTDMLPYWIRKVIGLERVQVDEHAWNCYPYTRTEYNCSLSKSFSLTIETKYLPDGGESENVLKMEQEKLNLCETVLIDIVNHKNDIRNLKKEEDPTLFISKNNPSKCPLTKNWLTEILEKTKSMRDDSSLSEEEKANKIPIMCAYKLVSVNFSGIWGLQRKIEEYILEYGIRRTILHGHLQAWVWQDEFHGISLEQIRKMEKETATYLQKCNLDELKDEN